MKGPASSNPYLPRTFPIFQSHNHFTPRLHSTHRKTCSLHTSKTTCNHQQIAMQKLCMCKPWYDNPVVLAATRNWEPKDWEVNFKMHKKFQTCSCPSSTSPHPCLAHFPNSGSQTPFTHHKTRSLHTSQTTWSHQQIDCNAGIICATVVRQPSYWRLQNWELNFKMHKSFRRVPALAHTHFPNFWSQPHFTPRHSTHPQNSMKIHPQTG